MQTFIACAEPMISTPLRVCLGKLGVQPPRMVTYTPNESLDLSGAEKGLVFFGCQQFGEEQLAALRQICATGGGKHQTVAVMRTANEGAALQAIRCGAVDCLSIDTHFERDLTQLLQRLTAQQEAPGKQGRVISLVSAGGGTGASVVAVSLAAIFAQREASCGLIDLHLRGGDLATLLNTTPRHTLSSLAAKDGQLDRTMLEQTFQRHDTGIHLLSGPEPFTDPGKIRTELIHKILNFARGNYPTVIVDAETSSQLDPRTLAGSDRVLVMVRPEFVNLLRTKKLLQQLAAVGVTGAKLMLVVNRADQPKAVPLSQIEEALGIRKLFQLPHDPSGVTESANLGVPLTILNPKSKMSGALTKLADVISGAEEVSPTTDRFSFGGKRLFQSFRGVATLLCALG